MKLKVIIPAIVMSLITVSSAVAQINSVSVEYTLNREFEVKDRGESLESDDIDDALILNAGISASF